MDKNTLSIIGQARALRALCNELAHGAGREGFVARVDDEIARLTNGRVGLAIVLLDGAEANTSAALLGELAQAPLGGSCALTLLTPATGGQPAGGADVVHASLAPAAHALGIDRALVVADPRRVFGSPVLLGRLIEACDVVLLVGGLVPLGDAVVGALRRLGESARYALRLDPPADDPLTARLDGGFKECHACSRLAGEASWLPALARELGAEARAAALAEAGAARLALCADLLNKHVQAEVSLLKFRVADLARLRRGEDAQEPGGDPREQAEMLKRTLEEWTDSCRADLAASAEQGVLPFDPRMLANRLTEHDLLHREEKAAAVIKYPILGSPLLHPLVTHHFTVLPDPGALERVREHLVSALSTQSHKDVDTLNQRALELTTRLKANIPLYPSFAAALGGLRVPVLPAGAVDRPVAGVTLESEAEDKFVRVGFFKRLMEGRMVASMAFSFLTMSAGVFVLFGDPSIKRGLMKFSGVIVIMMVLYFIFSMMVKGEEEHQQLDEVLERVRARLNQDISRPLGKAQAALLKLYNAFVDDVAASVLALVESVSRTKLADRARVTEQRKAEDEVVKAFVARRQSAAMAAAQKTTAFVTALERVRAEIARPAVPAATRPAPAAAPAGGVAAPAPSAAAPAAAVPTLAERAAAARAQALERVSATAAKPMSASERLALARAGSAPAGASATAAPASSAATKVAAPAPAATNVAAPAAATASPAPFVGAAPSTVPVAASAAPAPAPATADAPAAD